MNAAAHNVHMACPEIHRALKSVEVDVSGRKSSMQEKLNWTNSSPIRNFPVPIMTSFRLKTMLQNHFLKVVSQRCPSSILTRVQRPLGIYHWE